MESPIKNDNQIDGVVLNCRRTFTALHIPNDDKDKSASFGEDLELIQKILGRSLMFDNGETEQLAVIGDYRINIDSSCKLYVVEDGNVVSDLQMFLDISATNFEIYKGGGDYHY